VYLTLSGKPVSAGSHAMQTQTHLCDSALLEGIMAYRIYQWMPQYEENRESESEKKEMKRREEVRREKRKEMN
jgi:hypothetical protein